MGALGSAFAFDTQATGRNAVLEAEARAHVTNGVVSPAGCAIITRDFLPYARTLAESYVAHYPTGRFYLLVLDPLPPGVEAGGGIRVLRPGEIACPYYWEMAVRYDAFELSCALKPFLVATLLDRFNERAVYYFDSDVLIMRRLVEAERMLEHAEILLTPHVLQPIAPDGKQPDELYILTGGVYNMGFFAVRAGAGARRFLDWWSSRLRAGCVSDLAAGLYHDQRWIDLCLPLFPSAAILRDESCNVAYWNLHERRLARSANGYEVNGRPVTFFHFSGFDVEARAFKPSHQDRIVVHEGSPLATLLDEYAAALTRHGRETCRSWSSAVNVFDNGLPLHALLRKLYLALGEQRRREFGNPFATGARESFLAWAVRPAPLLSPFLRAVYLASPEAQERFPDVEGRDYALFLEWASGPGAEAFGFSPTLVHRGRVERQSHDTR